MFFGFLKGWRVCYREGKFKVHGVEEIWYNDRATHMSREHVFLFR